MKLKRYFLLTIVLLLLLGTFLTIGLISSRRIMLDLIKEQARSLLSVVASTQENLIFAEARLEDEFIDKLIGVCSYIETRLIRKEVEGIRQSFGFSSIVVFDAKTKKRIVTAGTPINIPERIFVQNEPISFEYFDFASRKLMRFVYVLAQRIYQIELPADEIQEFRTEFGINKIMNMIAANPMVVYLVLQDEKGILFATPNVQTVSRIDDDPALMQVMEKRTEISRIEEFNEYNVLELVRPFVVEEDMVGIFRIGISLENYNHHVRRTEGQLLILFLILFGAGFILFLLFMNYQSYANIKELFDRTLGAIEDGVLLVNKKSMIGGANKMFCSLSAFDENMLVGNRYNTIFPDDPFDVNKVMEQGKKISDEKSLFGKDIQYDTYPLSDRKQRVAGVITILHDISKIREFEKEREEAERLVFLGNLVANFAHEIKNPLNGLSIATQRLVREFPSVDEEYVRITKGLKKEIDALTKIVNDFLVLARPKMKEKRAFKVSTVIEEVKEQIDHQVREYGIKLDYSIKADVEILGSADDLRRALLNILLNAIDAVVGVEDRAREIRISMSKSDDAVVLAITDNGMGMDKEETERVFNPYFTTKKSGTGLGLYIAQKIIRDHQGRITIASKKNRGTVFTITFEPL
jgi:signal transduction histidine kinase